MAFLTAVTYSVQVDETFLKTVEFIHLVVTIGELAIEVNRDSSLKQKLASNKQLVIKLGEDLKKANKIVDKLILRKLKEQHWWSREQKIRNYKIKVEVDFLDTALVDNIDVIEIEDNVTSVVVEKGVTTVATRISSSIPVMGAVINICGLFVDCLLFEKYIVN